jgi:hypothetical protein
MQRMSAYCFVFLTFLGVFPALGSPANDLRPEDVGSSQWFDAMRKSDNNLAMLKALAGSNSQAVVPPDCVEVSGVFTFIRGNPFPKGSIPALRIVSTDDRMDNVPRSPFVYQSNGEAPYFYSVLKRDLLYEFYWLGERSVEGHCSSWKVPADAPKQLRLAFSVGPQGGCKITVSVSARRPSHK